MLVMYALQRLLRSRMSMNWNNASRASEQIWIMLFIECAAAKWHQHLAIYVLEFSLEADILSIWCKDDTCLTIFKILTASCILLFNDSLKCACSYCVDSSVYHFKFPQVVLALISGEMRTLCSFVNCWTFLPIFVKITSYLTHTERKR